MKRTMLFSSALLALTLLHAPAFAASPANLEPVLAAHSWLNGHLTPDNSRGRVVLVDVFTFECINCVRVTPNLQRLYRTYSRRDLEIVAVHTPEVPSYQGRLGYLRDQIAKASIGWPVVVDNDYRIWQAVVTGIRRTHYCRVKADPPGRRIGAFRIAPLGYVLACGSCLP